MNETTKKLLELISQGKTVNQISDTMGISHKRLFNYLTMIRNKGFDFDRKYYDTGDIVYVPKKSIVPKEYQGTNVITDKNSSNYTAMVISDLHFGSGFEIEGIMDKIYDFCVRKGIHNIIIAGDILDGTFSRVSQRISNPYDQIEYFLKKYPFDKNIITFALMGDHDYSILRSTGQDFSLILQSYRHDIVSLGYGLSSLNVKNDAIGIMHSINNISTTPVDCSIMLVGHTHQSKLNFLVRKNSIYLPSLSKMNYQGDSGLEGLPGVVVLTVYLNHNIITSAGVKQFAVLDRIYSVNEATFTVSSCPKNNSNNIEDYSKVFKKK